MIFKVQRYHGGSKFKSLRVMEDFRKKVTRIVFSKISGVRSAGEGAACRRG